MGSHLNRNLSAWENGFSLCSIIRLALTQVRNFRPGILSEPLFVAYWSPWVCKAPSAMLSTEGCYEQNSSHTFVATCMWFCLRKYLNKLTANIRNINNLRYADDTTLMAESEEELKSLLMEVKEESEKVGLKLSIQKTKIMASDPITSWQIDGETVADFIFLGSKITADGDYSHEIKRRLLLGRKVMTNLDSIFKSRDITLLTKVRLVKAMVFPVVMYGCESWTIKKAEC